MWLFRPAALAEDHLLRGIALRLEESGEHVDLIRGQSLE
jgi:hypothetical protein